MVTMQVNTPIRSIAMLQRRLHPWQAGWRSYAACRGKDFSCGTTGSNRLHLQVKWHATNRQSISGSHNLFFHEYGRRVSMVPRSSLKEGKNSQMVEKRTKTPKPNQHQQTPQAHRPNLHHLVVFSPHWMKRVKQKLMAIKGLNSRKTRTTAQVCG